MLRTVVRWMLVLVGGHLLLGLILIITEAIHGVNDQDASFALALAVYYANWPSVWVLTRFAVPLGAVPIVLTGICQWVVVALALGSVHHLAMSRCRTAASAGNPLH